MRDLHQYAKDPHKALSFLEAFRTALIRTGVMVAVFSVGGYLAAGTIVRFLQRLTGVKLVAYGIPETFFAFLTAGPRSGFICEYPLSVVFDPVSPLPALCHPGHQHRRCRIDADSGYI